ncbi:hypothetical protein FQA39_LY08508 [Lamprigera yunnana]|nr:hypothetical protein FQA39_LY08508 [Lamprigera yunnana]
MDFWRRAADRSRMEIMKNHPSKSHSTCSDGSLLSMGSSDIDEDSFGHQSSKNSSKLSLHEKKTNEADSEWELGPSHASAPLNHSAAHHRVAVRPKRTHGAPRRNRMPPVIGSALPTTPEVNEDTSLRSATPEVTRELVTELSSNNNSMSKTRTEIQLKCSSLPPGLAPPNAESNKLSRSRSSASSKSQDTFSALGEEDEERDEKKSENSIFARLFPRRSGKKKKGKQENISTSVYNVESDNIENTVTSVNVCEKKVKSGPASRQRVLPIDIPVSPDVAHREVEVPLVEKSIATPLQQELESHLRQRMTLSLSTSPTKIILPNIETPPKSPKMSDIYNEPSHPVWSDVTITKHIDSNIEEVKSRISTRISVEEKSKVKLEENKSKVKIAGLSSLQQRVLQLNDEENYKSLNDFVYSEETSSQVRKSHSFKGLIEKTSIKNEFQKHSLMDDIDSFQNMDSIKNVKNVTSLEIKKSVGSLESISSEYLEGHVISNGITISGPSHTSVVNVSKSSVTPQYDNKIVKCQPVLLKEEISQEDVTKDQVSITKIQLKHETAIKESIPEFLNVHLNKVDALTNNIVLMTNANEPQDCVNEEKSIFNFELPLKNDTEITVRKFSHDDIEIIDKDVNEELFEVVHKPISTPSTPNVVITSMTPPPSARIFKKHIETVQTRKTSLVSVTTEKPKLSLRTKSNSLDIVDSLKQDENVQINLEKQRVLSTTDLSDNTVVRRKSLIKHRQDEEPELMKVFARRSLKVKDSDDLAQQVLTMIEDAKSENANIQDSNKENQLNSATDERKKLKEAEKIKEPLTETKFVETTEVTLRKPINNKIFAYQQRTISVNIPKAKEIILEKVQKKNSFLERPKTDISDKLINKTWITTVRKDKEVNSNDEIKKIARSDIITEITPKSDFINEDFPTIPKNFNQRKAEWEKRAQEALKKNVP